MACITVSFDKSEKTKIDIFPWINWSEVAREEALKKEIFERYLKTGKVTDDDWEFCEQTDWHPVDELPEKEEFRRGIEEAKKEKPLRFRSVGEFFKSVK